MTRERDGDIPRKFVTRAAQHEIHSLLSVGGRGTKQTSWGPSLNNAATREKGDEKRGDNVVINACYLWAGSDPAVEW